MKPFRTTRTLRFGDCDPSGIAYFPAYFNHLVGVVEELFAAAGVPWPTLFSERRIGTPTVRLDVTFTAPGMHGDQLDWEVQVLKLGRSSLALHHVVTRGGTRLWEAMTHHKSIAWPDDVRTGLTPFLDPAHAHDPSA